MQIETNALAYNAESFHSSKTNQDYHKVGLIIEGVATNFFVTDSAWKEFQKEPCFNAICAAHVPTEVKILLTLRFDEKGCKTFLDSIKGAGKK